MATSVDVAAVHRRIWSAEWLIEQVPVSSESEMSRLCMPIFVVAALKDGGIVRRRSLPDRICFSKNNRPELLPALLTIRLFAGYPYGIFRPDEFM